MARNNSRWTISLSRIRSAARLLAAGLLAASLFSDPASAQPVGVEISEAVFTSNVRDRQFVDRLPGTAPLRPLTFWTMIHADKVALDILQKEFKLPIRHRWTRAVGTIPEQSTETLIDEIPLDVGSAETFAKLAQEVTQVGHFTWRTWSEKRNLRPGKWIVSLHYRNGDPVYCGGNPCKYFITVSTAR